MPKIIVSAKQVVSPLLPRVDIYLDYSFLKKVRKGKTYEFELRAGKHALTVEGHRYRSKPFEFEIEGYETKEFELLVDKWYWRLVIIAQVVPWSSFFLSKYVSNNTVSGGYFIFTLIVMLILAVLVFTRSDRIYKFREVAS